MKKVISFMTLCGLLHCSFIINAQVQNLEHQSPPEPAQKWQQLMTQPGANFLEIKAAFDNEWSGREYERGQGFKQYKRWEWLMEPRVQSNGEPYDASLLNAAFAEDRRRCSLMPERNGALWTYIGNESTPEGGGNGRVNVVRVDPNDADTYYACAASGGLWKTADAGANWSQLNMDNLLNLGCSDVAIDPNDSNILYVATGDANLMGFGSPGQVYSYGVIKSIDGGQTWFSTGLTYEPWMGVGISTLLMDPNDSNILIAASTNGVFRTTDGGTTWTHVLSNVNCKAATFKADDSNVIFIGSVNGQIFRSNDNGITFQDLTESFYHFGLGGRVGFGTSIANPNVVYTVIVNFNTNGLLDVWKSNDGGLTFTPLQVVPNLLAYDDNGNEAGGQGFYDLAVAVDPLDEDNIFVGGINTWASTDGGVSWNIDSFWRPYILPDEKVLHADQHYFTYVGNTGKMLVANDGGVFYRDPNNGSYVDISSNLQIAQLYRCGISQVAPQESISGWQDNGTNLGVNNAWSEIRGGDGFECIIDPNEDETYFTSIYYGSISKLSQGQSENVCSNSGAGVNEAGRWLTPYSMDPTDNQHLYIGKSKMYESFDGGSSWTALGELPNATALIVEYEVALSNDDIIYVSTGDKIYKTTNGQDFDLVLDFPGIYVTSIEIDPINPDNVWISLSNFNPDSQVFTSEDGGQTWAPYTAGLPYVPINMLTYQTGTNDLIYAATDIGVYYKDATMNEWVPYHDDLPNTIITDLEINYNVNEIVAATYGRGLWKAPLVEITTSFDAALLKVISPRGNNCGASISPEVRFSNAGSTAINSVTFNYGEESNPIETYTWTGTLSAGEFLEITLPEITFPAGDQTVVVNIATVNGMSDDNQQNNSASRSFYLSGQEDNHTLTIQTDCSADETNFFLRLEGELISSGNQINDGDWPNNSFVSTNFCLAEGCYTLKITDWSEDGFIENTSAECPVPGSVTFGAGDSLLYTLNGNFGSEDTFEFCVEMGCQDPTACNYAQFATVNDPSDCIYAPCPDCTGDFNNDYEVNSGDLVVLLGDYGCMSNCLFDMNNDDIVNVTDIISFLEVFGTDCF